MWRQSTNESICVFTGGLVFPALGAPGRMNRQRNSAVKRNCDCRGQKAAKSPHHGRTRPRERKLYSSKRLLSGQSPGSASSDPDRAATSPVICENAPQAGDKTQLVMAPHLSPCSVPAALAQCVQKENVRENVAVTTTGSRQSWKSGQFLICQKCPWLLSTKVMCRVWDLSIFRQQSLLHPVFFFCIVQSHKVCSKLYCLVGTLSGSIQAHICTAR